MKVTLINHTQDAAELLLFTKSTRLTMSPGLMEEIRAWPQEKKLAELEYMANTIPSSWEMIDYIFLVEGEKAADAIKSIGMIATTAHTGAGSWPAAITEYFAGAQVIILPDNDVVLFSDYGKGGLTHVAQMIAAARTLGKPVLIDPKGSDYARYAGATVITPNRAELREVVGPWRDDAHLTQLAQGLRHELGLKGLLVTRSEEGMTLFDEAGTLHVSAQAREVFDVTGAGDTVIATLAALLACGLSLRDALPWANKAGGIVVGKFGTASVSWAELAA